MTTINVASVGNDDPWRENLDDKLGVKDEASAFARIAAARQFNPPLAFGIFGDWGSGKSFFMRLMYEYVAKISDGKTYEAKSGLFHEDIAQIRFNAWHYVETNLWASLVDHIFSELDRWVQQRRQSAEQDTLFDNLATARELTLDSAELLVLRRKEQKVAAERLAGAERKLIAEREEIGATPRLFWQVVRKHFVSQIGQVRKEDLDRAAATLGLTKLAVDAEALTKALDSFESEAQRAKAVTRGILHRLRSAPSLIFLLLAIVLVPPALLWSRDALVAVVTYPEIKNFITSINSTVLGAAGVLAAFASLAGVVTKNVRSAVVIIEGFRGELDEVVAEQVKEPTEEVKSAEKNLAKLMADVDEARALLGATSNQLAEAAREYASGTGRGRLLRFVRERATDGQYAKHLGLIASIRRDFTELSAMMSSVDKEVRNEKKKQIEAYLNRVAALIAIADEDNLLTPEEKQKLTSAGDPKAAASAPAFQRIILYIDDLDRCPPKKVVDVLQAVHLLLTFPLFVVVVAVDARWVGRSLETHYENLLDQSGNGGSAGATARDYLEKIFQVPYWVRAMTPKGSGDLLADLATSSIELPRAPAQSEERAGSDGDMPSTSPVLKNEEKGGASIDGAATPSPASVNCGENSTAGRDESNDPNPEPPAAERSKPLSSGPGTLAPPSLDSPQNEERDNIVIRALELTAAEKAFITRIAPHVGTTPRRALRFLNVYRVIKASLSAEDLAQLENDGGYRGLMTQIAIATGSPSLQQHWLGILNIVDDDENLELIRNRLNNETWFSGSSERTHLDGAVEAFWSESLVEQMGGEESDPAELAELARAILQSRIASLKHYSDLAKRYSFGS